MNFEKLDKLFSSSASVRLVRSQNAALILSFLHKEFKVTNRIIITNQELTAKLGDFLALNEEKKEDETEERDWVEVAKRQLDYWTDQNFLKKFPDETGEHVHELTHEAEKTFQFVELLEKKQFVGTESRFKDIFNKLQDIVDNSNDNPVEKIRELEKKKKDIEEEIRQIKITQSVPVFNETQVKERFFEVNRIGRELLSDFKEVEQNFKDIIRNIYEKQSDKSFHKGTIVGYALDALEELKEKDQGKSFYSFWSFLIADKRQEELKTLVDSVYHLMDEKGIDYENEKFLKRIKSSLHTAGKKVIDSNKQLSSKLSKVLAERDLMERRKAMELISEIRSHALKLINKPPKEEAFIVIDDYANINMIMQRPLGEPHHESLPKAIPIDAGEIDLSMVNLDTLFNQFSINKTQILQNISEMLKDKNQISLREIIEIHPVQKGLAEVLTYLSIASQSNRHIISDSEFEKLEINSSQNRYIRVPQVIFTK